MTSLRQIPEPISRRTGCKVQWASYDDEALAKLAADVARHNARVLEAQGYEWGYQSPGQITEPQPGIYEVCLP